MTEPVRSQMAKTIMYGAFKGMGDLLNAAPVIKRELDAGRLVKVLHFPGFSIEKIVALIDFGPNRANLELIDLPISGRPRDVFRFFSQMAMIRPDLVWISPHTPRPVSSWKIPLLLWIARTAFSAHSKIVGATSERLSMLFDVRVPVDRSLPLMQREREAFSVPEAGGCPSDPGYPLFIEKIRRHREAFPSIDLLIHPGANVPNRRWPWSNFAALVRMVPEQYRIAVLGVPADIDEARRILPADRGIRFLSGTLEDAIVTIASSRVLFCMDSGPAHFAACLRVPAVALFGKSDPASIIGYQGSVRPLYVLACPCQPCGKATCIQPEVLCMNAITPEAVAHALLPLLSVPWSTSSTVSHDGTAASLILQSRSFSEDLSVLAARRIP